MNIKRKTQKINCEKNLKKEILPMEKEILPIYF